MVNKDFSKDDPNQLPIEYVKQLVASAESRAHCGTTLINILERFREDLTPTEQTVIISTIQTFFPGYMRQIESSQDLSNDDFDSPPAGTIEKDQSPSSEEPKYDHEDNNPLHDNENDLTDEELADMYPQQNPKPETLKATSGE